MALRLSPALLKWEKKFANFMQHNSLMTLNWMTEEIHRHHPRRRRRQKDIGPVSVVILLILKKRGLVPPVESSAQYD